MDKDKYKKQITAWFNSVAESTNKELSNMAISSLSQNYMNEGDYEEAEKLLDKIPAVGFDKRITLANLYIHQMKYDKAYEIHEGMIYQSANNIIASLATIIDCLCDEKNYEAALRYADLAESLAEKFDLGKYVGISSKLIIYMELKDKENTLEILSRLIKNIDNIGDAKNSKLYTHMKFKEESSINEMKDMIIKALKSSSELDFLKDDIKFKIIMDKLNK